MEREKAQACTARLAERIRLDKGSDGDWDLLARLLTKEINMEGETIQIAGRPSITLWTWTEHDLTVDGIGALVTPSVKVDGTEADLPGYPTPFFIASSRFYCFRWNGIQ